MLKTNAFPDNRGICHNLALPLLLCIFLSFQNSTAQTTHDATGQRIQFLDRSLHCDQQGTKLWWYSWLGLYGAATVGQGAAYFASNEKSTRQDMALGAATTFVGVIGQFISTFQPVSFADKLALLPESTESDRLAKIKLMEKCLADRSKMEVDARKWKAHILCTSINLASGLVTWIGFHRTVWDGVVNFGWNCVITETQIWTQPIRAKRALKRYREQLVNQDSSLRPTRDVNCNFMVTTSGAGVRVTF
jgi:hypothetical protein